MKRNVFGALMTLIVAATIAVPMVHAQSTQRMLTADVPFAFAVGSRQMPTGSYDVSQIGDRATLIETRDGHNRVLGIYQYAGPAKSGETKLVFHKVGDRYFLAEIWTSANGQGQQLPVSKLEKEMTASNHVNRGGAEAVIVALR